MNLPTVRKLFEAAMDLVVYNLNIIACDIKCTKTVIYKLAVLKPQESRLRITDPSSNDNLATHSICPIKHESIDDCVIIMPIGNLDVYVIIRLDYYLVTWSSTQCKRM